MSIPTLIQKMYAHQAISFNEGEFIMLGWPAIVFPLNTFIMIQKISDDHSNNDFSNTLYHIGYQQGIKATKNLLEKYGYTDKKKLVDLLLQNPRLWGGGILEMIRIDFKNCVLIIKNTNTPMAKQYVKMFGIQKNPTDHFLRGIIAGTAAALFDSNDIIGIETKCIAQGNPFCLFEAKKKNEWDLKKDWIKKQLPGKFSEKELLEKKMSLNYMLAPK